MKLIHGTFYGTKVAVYNVTISKIRKTKDYKGLDYIFQTNEQLTHILFCQFRDEDSTTPITSDYEGLYKCVIDNRTLAVGVYNTSTYNNNK